MPKFNAPEVESAWVGSLECVPVHCNRSATFRRGYFTCEHAIYGEFCQLECNVGFALQDGNGSYFCNADAKLVGQGVCREVPCPGNGVNLLEKVANARSSSCPEKFNSSVQCGVTCQDGYTSRGMFSCFYGGFTQMPSCIADGTQADVKRYTLSSITVVFSQLPQQEAEQIAIDDPFWRDCRLAIADSLNEVELIDVVVENVVVLAMLTTSDAGAGDPRLWIAFKVRAQNHSAVNHWLSTEQAARRRRHGWQAE